MRRPQRKPNPRRAKTSPCRNGCQQGIQGISDEEAVVGASVAGIVVVAAVNLAFLGGLVYIGYRIGKK